MPKWKFPNGQGLTPKGVNNPSIEIFLDNVAESLTREVLQNSLDAKDKSKEEAVEIRFDFFEMPTENISNIKSIKDEALPKALELWTEKNNKDTLDFLKRFSDVLHAPKVPVLKISDYNTTGLNKKKYESLVLGDGYSEKDDTDSAGSKGIGKAAPFAASDLRMVFYNTLANEGTEKSVGVMNFVSFKIKEENFITQERATCVDAETDYIAEQQTFGYPKRKNDEFGTDIFIIGLKNYDEWTQNIVLSTLNNFLLAIIQGKLVVKVGKRETINDVTVHSLMKRIYEENTLSGDTKAQFLKTYRFYEVLTSEQTLDFDLDERFIKYPFVKDVADAKLYLLQHEPANRTVLQTRAAGMKIYERNRVSGNINFSGVFQALGKELNAYLKDLENANHDTWSIDRKQGVAHQEAADFLKDLLQWYKAKVQEAFADISTDVIDAFGVNDLLPLNEQQTEGEKKQKDSGIKNNFEDFKLSRKNNTNQTLDGNKEEDLLKNVLEAVGIGDGDTSGSGGKREGSGDGDSPHTNYGSNEEPGDKGSNSEDEEVIANKEKRVGPSTSIKLKIIELNAAEGKYRIVGKVLKKSKAIEVELKSIGANGVTYPLKVVDVASQSNEISIKRNAVRLESLSKNIVFSADISIDSKLRLKMEGTVYEIKS
ncbi:hypothetical protein COF07_19190 [Bacillus wiedmannii]|uniref:hypothetical protein n=1 Tax=Bacillus wiedmannii TaxID=1890302 RepID=UPI00027AC267|nr:hypothetical protein [Bacillus wiedmannii]EJS64562.1 hypothetical protein ICW_04836 [Bacillus wiedmannii]OOR28476.1 hypothetical protein BW893_05205 [Bacillus wiedmannii]PFO74508.1 hypothetical protein COJ86_07205 [Bacillus cereus]PHA55261.1 hypothetical protein COF07_19190 [Bacillus wiedmannii]